MDRIIKEEINEVILLSRASSLCACVCARVREMMKLNSPLSSQELALGERSDLYGSGGEKKIKRVAPIDFYLTLSRSLKCN